MIEIDYHEVRQLELDLSRAPGRMQRASRQTLKYRAGPILAAAMRRDATGHQGNYFGIAGTEFSTPLEKHVSHEMRDLDTVEAGIENKGAGRLGNIIAKGSANNAPAYDFMSGPRRVLPRIEAILADDVENAVLGSAE